MSRTLRAVENFVAFAPSNNADQTTQYAYDGSNHVLTLAAVLPGGSTETTQYTYGVTGSVINSNELLATVTYPATGQTNTETYTYDALGEMATKTDRNGTTHSYTYDVLGRKTGDTVTTLGANVDGTVTVLGIAYDTGGRPYVYTSGAVNQVQQVYNGLGQLLTEYQAQSGSVTPSTLKVQYGYTVVATFGGSYDSRLTSITYPSITRPKLVIYNYDSIGRFASVYDQYSSVTLEAYSYLGLNTVVQRTHPQPAINLSYVISGGNTDGGDQYTGLDRFGRVVEQRWAKTSPVTVTDDFLYTYDRDSNRLTRNNALNSSFNEQYSYDGLNQLASFTQEAEKGDIVLFACRPAPRRQ